MNFTNALTQLLNIQYPILSAPMANVAGGKLASAVTKAGGLGFIGGGYCHEAWIKQELQYALPRQFGIGFITWRLAEFPAVLDLAIAHQPRAIFLSFGNIEPFVEKIKAANIMLICQVQTVAQAQQAQEFGVDIIVAQGSEAGGHGASRGSFTLIPAIVDAVKNIPVVAAGGIADGRGLAAAFMLGATGGLLGTRFYASPEALGSVQAKQRLIAASGDDTFRSTIFDFARGLTWPQPYTARALKNQFTQQWENKDNLKQKIDKKIQQEYQQAVDNNNYDIAGIFAGENLDLIHEILSAEEIINKIMQEFKATLKTIE
ncbi:MAG: nitronate monooxygenase [Legionellales bacterium]|nr:nitronate monooxygenase [Legionellales bacterium]